MADTDYTVGETIILQATFTDEGAPAAPQEPVQAYIRRGRAATEAPLAMTSQGGGAYELQYVPQAAGYYYWEARSADGGIERDTFSVEEAL